MKYLILSLLFMGSAFAETRAQCRRRVQRQYFVGVDRAMMNQRTRDQNCRKHITTVDNLLRCLRRSERLYKKQLRQLKLQKRRGLARCRRL